MNFNHNALSERSKDAINHFVKGTIAVVSPCHCGSSPYLSLAHEKIPVSLSLLQSLFVGSIIVLVWLLQWYYSGRRCNRLVAGSLLSSMAGASPVWLYHHFIDYPIMCLKFLLQVGWLSSTSQLATLISKSEGLDVDWAVGIESLQRQAQVLWVILKRLITSFVVCDRFTVLGTVTDAEDVVWKPSCAGSKQRKPVKSAKTYLSTITTRLCIDHLHQPVRSGNST